METGTGTGAGGGGVAWGMGGGVAGTKRVGTLDPIPLENMMS